MKLEEHGGVISVRKPEACMGAEISGPDLSRPLSDRIFGDVLDQFHHPEYTDILILSNVKKDGKPMGLADGGTYWHSDYSYLEIPARATLLYSMQVPKVGGDTLFADQEQAYEDLP